MNPKDIPHTPHNHHHHDDKSALDNLRVSKVFFPIIIGIGVIIWMMSRQLDIQELSKLNLSNHTLFWLFLAILMYVTRHLFYAWRLRIMSDYAFSWPKAIELIIIWEFSSSVSPTSVGGAGVAFFLLSQEKLSGAKTISVVLYSMVIDTVFFVFYMPLLYIFLGPIMIRPGMHVFSDIDGYGITFLTVLFFMMAYGALFFYGLFINPRSIKRLLIILSRWPILKRFREDLRSTAYDIVTTSVSIKNKPISFHLWSFGATTGAWITRFFAINCLIVALVSGISPAVYDHLIILARGMAMHTITAFSPTPGAAGVAEFLFGGFYSDYIPVGIAVLIALVWRLISYYSYLLAGAIIIPVWFRQVQKRKRLEKAEIVNPD
ncbi:MAG: flippase-like domain-containing protein [Saprospiraceae bacterium]|nr:flippase-like domain-containing protein [Saprospiraceae bacterium]